MNLTLTLIGLRGLALLSLLSGKTKLSDTLYLTADLVAAGKATDEQLQLVADKLASRRLEENDWVDVYERINQSRDVLHAPTPPAGQAGRARVALLVLLALAGGLALPALSAEPAVRQAQLSWTAPTQYVDGTTIAAAEAATLRYNVYRGARGTLPAAKVKVASNVSTLAYLDAGRPPGEDCYQVTALFDGQPATEGGPSAEGCKSYPRPAAGAPTLTVQ